MQRTCDIDLTSERLNLTLNYALDEGTPPLKASSPGHTACMKHMSLLLRGSLFSSSSRRCRSPTRRLCAGSGLSRMRTRKLSSRRCPKVADIL